MNSIKALLQLKCFKAVTVMAGLFILGCASTPLPDITFTEINGCGLTQWNKQWVDTNVASLKWSGDCKSGRTEGHGILEGKLKDGGNIRYEGWMQKGRFETAYYDFENNRYEEKPAASLTIRNFKAKGTFVGGAQVLGDSFVDDKLQFSGYRFNNNWHTGTVYFPDGTKIKGEFLPGNLVSVRGKGIASGQHLTKDDQPITWFVDEKTFKSEAEYITALDVRNARIAREQKAVQDDLSRQVAENESLTRRNNEKLKLELIDALKAGGQIAAQNRERKQQKSNSVHNITYELDRKRSTEGMKVYVFGDLGPCIDVVETGKRDALYIQKTAIIKCATDVQFFYREYYGNNYDYFSLSGNHKASQLTDWAKKKPITKTQLRVCPSRPVIERMLGAECSQMPVFEESPIQGCACTVYAEVGTAK